MWKEKVNGDELTLARRRRKKEDPVAQLVGGIAVLLAGWVGYQTYSILMAGLTLLLVMVVALVIIYFINQKKEERLKQSGIRDIDQMDGRQFEHYLGLLFRSHGYKVEVTRAAGDYGADLVIQKDGKKIVVQAKRYSKNVGIDAVQQAQASIAHYKAHEAWVVSNRDYTEAARNLASSNSVRLISREMLIEMMLKMNPASKPDPKKVIAQMPQKTLQCDRCGNEMIRRKGPKGEFFGCSNYPKCRNTKAV
ncbi:restriction endonuclease [Brevibacillus centrosporus]|uniref:restriction endonuclease n=1 Tax=Brevibacillus centrosporus TaxID=54910 RepID=UPI003B02E2DB